MGVYKKAVITNAGRALMARSIAGEIVMQFSRVVTSSHIYPSDTDFKGYTSLEDIQQTVIPSNVQVVNDTLISVRGLFGNESILESYLIQNIGLCATDGSEEVLFSVSQAATPDEMPAYNGVAPSSFIYTIQVTVLQADSLSLTINPAGTATTQDILDLDGAKLEIDGDISETVIETLEVPETEFPVPEVGESTKGFMGKIKKFISDFNAFKTGIITLGKLVNNGQTTEPGFALDARYGKTLADAITQLNANLTNTFDTVQGTNCRVLYNRACVFIEINCTGISLTGGNFFNNVFALPPNVKLKTSVFATVTMLDSSYTPFSPANDGTIAIGSDGTFNVRCSTSVTNATITGHVTLPRSFVAIT